MIKSMSIVRGGKPWKFWKFMERLKCGNKQFLLAPFTSTLYAISKISLYNYKIKFRCFLPQPTFFLRLRLWKRIVCNKNTKTKNRNTNKREQHETRERREEKKTSIQKSAKKVHVCLHVQRLWCVSTFTLTIQPQTVFSLFDAFERNLIRWVWSQIEGRINSYKDKAVLMYQEILKMKIVSMRNFPISNFDELF